MTQSKTIQKDSLVQMHFSIRLKDGSVADSTQNVGAPIEFTMGAGAFSEKLEAGLIGLSVGEKKNIMLMPEDAFGIPHDANIMQVPLERFSEIKEPLEEGLIINFTQMNGDDLPGIVRTVEEHEVTVDFNHPLSGQVVLFQVEILEIN